METESDERRPFHSRLPASGVDNAPVAFSASGDGAAVSFGGSPS